MRYRGCANPSPDQPGAEGMVSSSTKEARAVNGTRVSVTPAAVLPIRKRRRLQPVTGCAREPA
ncbi:MAG: hypothetical protein AcusKO_50840 [Acuticoccus sp.]